MRPDPIVDGGPAQQVYANGALAEAERARLTLVHRAAQEERDAVVYQMGQESVGLTTALTFLLYGIAVGIVLTWTVVRLAA